MSDMLIAVAGFYGIVAMAMLFRWHSSLYAENKE
jgi:hypothetical protein